MPKPDPAMTVPLTTLRSVLLAILAYFLWSCGDVAVKLAGVEVPVQQVLFFTGLAALPCLLAIAARQNSWAWLRPQRPGLLICFTVAILLTSAGSIIAVTRLALAEYYVIFFASAFFMALLGMVVLHERVSASVWACIILGFLGTAIALDLIHAELRLSPFGLAGGLLSSFMFALSNILSRHARFDETSLGLMFWPALAYIAVFGGWMLFDAAPVVWPALPYMLVNGVTWVAGWLALIAALRGAAAALLAPLQYTLLLFGIGFDALLWHTMPSTIFYPGAALIVVTSLYLLRRGKAVGQA